MDTVKEIISEINSKYEYVVLLQPTSPIRQKFDIDNAIKLIIDNPEANSLTSIIKMEDIHPARMYKKQSNNYLSSLMHEFSGDRRQELPDVYYRNGSIYITKISSILESNSILNPPIIGYQMDNQLWLNIDDQRDLIISEQLINYWKSNK